MLWFMAAWSLLVYCADRPLGVGPRGGFLNDAGVLDFAGGTVVHINAGVAGLVGGAGPSASARVTAPRCSRRTI